MQTPDLTIPLTAVGLAAYNGVLDSAFPGALVVGVITTNLGLLIAVAKQQALPREKSDEFDGLGLS